MSKISIIITLILVYPILRIRWRKVYASSRLSEYVNLRMLRRMLHHVAHLCGLYSDEKHSPFLLLFLKHFHTERGAFEDQDLRHKVYNLLYKRLEQGTNYKSLYRVTASHLHPDRARASKLSEDELTAAFKYFQTHFKHPDNI